VEERHWDVLQGISGTDGGANRFRYRALRTVRWGRSGREPADWQLLVPLVHEAKPRLVGQRQRERGLSRLRLAEGVTDTQ
jgi:hypothetical protein